MNKVGAILVNYKGSHDTCECVKSLLENDCPNLKIYVVDNHSCDNSIELIESSFGSTVSILPLSDNLGFGAANNIAMDRAFEEGCDYALLINNDTIVDQGMISSLLSHIDSNTVVAPLMCYYDEPELVWFGGGRLNAFGIPKHEHYRAYVRDVPTRVTEVEFLTGCCLLIPKEVFNKVGGFDPAYFLYWEDADLSIRMRRAGVRLLFCPDAKLWHKVSSSTGGEDSPFSYYYAARNRLYAIRHLRLGWKPWLWSRLGILRGIVSKKGQYQYALKAYRDFRSGKMGKQL